MKKNITGITIALIAAILLLLGIGFFLHNSTLKNLKRSIPQTIISPTTNSAIDPSQFGELCDQTITCPNDESLTLISCHPEVDGPIYYVDSRTKEVLEVCGGACLGDCDREKCYALNFRCGL